MRRFPLMLLSILSFTMSCTTVWCTTPEDPDREPLKTPEQDDQGNPTDYYNPIRGGKLADGTVAYHVTVCAGQSLRWHPWGTNERNSRPQEDNHRNLPESDRSDHGFCSGRGRGGITVHGSSEGSSESTVSLQENDASVHKLYIYIHVIDCSKSKGVRGIAANAMGAGAGAGGMLAGVFTRTGEQDTITTGGDKGSATDSSDTVIETTQATAGQPGIFGATATVTASQKQYPVCPQGP